MANKERHWLQEGSIGHLVQQKPAGKEALPIQMQIGRRVRLEGKELEEWQAMQDAQVLEAEPMLVDKSMEDLEEELQGNSPLAEDELASRCPHRLAHHSRSQFILFAILGAPDNN